MKGRGKLRTYALDIINEICSYQSARELENDSAECMFLEELKHWATFELALYELRKDNLDQILKRIRYLEAVLAQDTLFYSLRWRSRTVQKIIIECCLRLKYQVVPEIKNEIALKCAREQLSEFRFELKEALQQGVYFLFHVFRDSGKTKLEPATMARMLRNEGEPMQTTSGRLLYHILTSGAFLEAFPDDSVEIRKRLAEFKTDSEEISAENKMDTATLYDPQGELCIPVDLWREITGDEDKNLPEKILMTKERLARLFDKKSSKTKSGLEPGFHGHPYVAEQFIKAHAALQELAKFVQIIIKAEKCAGGGGDLLIYGFANKQLNGLLETYRALVKTVRSQFEVLTRISELRFQQLVEKNMAEPERNTFVPHYRQVHTKFYHFDSQLSRTEDCCDEILSKANSLTLYERYQKLKRDTEDFITTSDTFAHHLQTVLKIPYNPAIGQQIMVSGPNIPNVEHLMKDTREKLMKGQSTEADVLPFAFEFLEKSSVGSVQLHSAPPALLELTNHAHNAPEETVSIADFTKVRERERVPIVEEPSKRKARTHSRSKSLSDKYDVSPIDLGQDRHQQEIEELNLKLKAAEASQLNMTMNLTKLPDVLPPVKLPKQQMSFTRMNLSQRTISDFCVQLEGLFKRPGQAVVTARACFAEVSALVHFLCFLENKADKIHTLNLRDNLTFELRVFDELLRLLCHPRCNIKVLNLSACGLTDVHAAKLIEILSFNTTLRRVYLTDNNFTDEIIFNLQKVVSEVTTPLPIKRLKIQKTKTQGNADLIPYTPRAISLLEQNIYRDPKRVVTLHEGKVPLTRGDVDKIAALQRYYGDCSRRKDKLREEKLIRKKKLESDMNAWDETLRHFRHLIHACQIYSRTFRADQIPERVILRAFSIPLYGISNPYTEEFVLKHVMQALDLKVFISREKVDGEVTFKLSPAAASYEPPLSSEITALMEKDGKELDIVMIWQFIMPYLGTLGTRPMTWSQLVSSLLSKDLLCVYDDEVIEAVLDLFIFRGVIYKDNNLMKLNPGDCPTDYTRFPGNTERKFVPSHPMKQKTSAIVPFDDNARAPLSPTSRRKGGPQVSKSDVMNAITQPGVKSLTNGKEKDKGKKKNKLFGSKK
eukprot:TRINITY_DN14165_c0_g1_i1.p1 TRINITY_DN14165_c0_g1~~TRINITY_DN14165_c0_g1_i1.p1  ORF type:complete len:1208 (-),score=272.89 TRINITY_DN14165_c0_g1_i1:80-3412(-)